MVDVYVPTKISEEQLANFVANPAEWQARFGRKGKKLHFAQHEVLTTDVQIKVVCWGRRGGKSIMFGENDIPRWGLARAGTDQYLLGPTQDQANAIYEYVAGVMIGTPLEVFVKEYKDHPWPHIVFFNDSQVGSRNTAERGKNLRSRGADRLIVDEAARQEEEAIDAVTPMMAASEFREEVYISTPRGLNYFWKLYRLGASGKNANIKSFHMPTWRNPYVSRSFLHDQRLKMTETAFRIEFGAEFVEDQNAPFPESVITAATDASLCVPAPPLIGHRYVTGYDPADTMDRSGLLTIDVTVLPWRVVNVQDIAGRGWNAQIDAVKRESQKYNNARVLIDATHGSVGDPLLAVLHKEGVRVEGLKFTAESKRQLIEGLSLLMEQGDIRFPDHADLIQELTFYRRDISKTGKTTTFGASAGEHDDLVTALALACQHAKRHRYTGNQTAVGGTRTILEQYDQSQGGLRGTA